MADVTSQLSAAVGAPGKGIASQLTVDASGTKVNKGAIVSWTVIS